MSPAEIVIKRGVDLLVSVTGIMLLLPMLLTFALIILLREGRPILYSERRMGRHRQLFTLFKFRSLNAANLASTVVTVEDNNLTRTGRLLRRRHLDELPQLFNILAGDMSLVGPRPMKPEHAISLPASTLDIVLSVKPGLTGPDALEFLAEDEALAGYPDAASLYCHYVLPAKAAFIRRYLAEYSLLLDLKIIHRTICQVFSAKAYASSRRFIRSLLPGQDPAI